MRKALLAIMVFLMVSGAAAQVQHSASVEENSTMLNSTIQLECSQRCPVTRFGITWSVPGDARIIEVRDSYGPIDDYDREGGSVRITSNSGEPRRTETIVIRMELENEAEEVYDGLHFRQMSLPALPEKETTGRVEAENMVSGWTGYGFRSSFTEDEMRFAGTGATNARVNFGEGEETRFYEFFGEKKEDVDQAYQVAVGSTGMVPEFERIPVAVMPSGAYNQTRPDWSSGEYRTGNIAMREDLGDNFVPVLAHETVHALNDRFLSWDRTRSSYLDEGVSEHVTYLMRKKLYRSGEIDSGTAEVFGESSEYRSRDSRFIYTKQPRGNMEELWSYYENDQDFMRQWSPSTSSNREFGYAYSELMVKYHIVNNGSIRGLYSRIEPGRSISDPDEKWSYLDQYMEMRPCDYESRQRFESCLNRVNSYEYPIYTAENIQHSGDTVEFEEIDLPNRTVESQPEISGELSFLDFVRGFLRYLGSLVSR